MPLIWKFGIMFVNRYIEIIGVFNTLEQNSLQSTQIRFYCIVTEPADGDFCFWLQ